MLLLLLGRFSFLALPLLFEPSFHCGVHPFLSMLPLSRQGAALAHLDSFPSDDLIWTDGSVHFPFGKGGSAAFANCSLCGTEATLSFSAGPVCSNFSAEACAILQGLRWCRQYQQVCHFSSLRLSPSFPSFLLPQTFRQELSYFFSFTNRLQWVPNNRFSRETPRLISWPDRERYFCPLQFLGSLLPHLSTGCVLSHLNSLTYRFR